MTRIPLELVGRDMEEFAVRVDPRHCANGATIVFVSNAICCHFPAIEELHLEPVPAYLPVTELAAGDFVIHPGFACHRDFGFTLLQCSLDCKAWPCDVVAGDGWIGVFLSEAFFSEEDSGF